MLELCSRRVHILELDEETLLKQASTISMKEMKLSIQKVKYIILHSLFFL